MTDQEKKVLGRPRTKGVRNMVQVLMPTFEKDDLVTVSIQQGISMSDIMTSAWLEYKEKYYKKVLSKQLRSLKK